LKKNSASKLPPKKEGRREQKRQETLQRVTEIGMKLFVARGFEGTTLDDIAKAAGISRRTFFYYFKSKEEILLARQGMGFPKALYGAMLEESPHQAPLDAVRHCVIKLAPRFETKESIIVDGLCRSTESLRVSKQAVYIEMESDLLKAMSELWPQTRLRTTLRLVAMTAMGVMRLSHEEWRQDGGKRSITQYLQENFSALKAGI
jgi:AcrR family transcriptional regulator